jgi:hypothetical protein
MAHVEDFGATDDYASIRVIGDIGANPEKFGSAKVSNLLDLRSLHVGIFDLRHHADSASYDGGGARGRRELCSSTLERQHPGEP